MKKSVIMMCIGAMFAVCTPLAASEGSIEPPVKKEIIGNKHQHSAVKNDVTTPEKNPVVTTNDEKNSAAEPMEGGGVIIISGTALLLLIILLIILL